MDSQCNVADLSQLRALALGWACDDSFNWYTIMVDKWIDLNSVALKFTRMNAYGRRV